jgi:hypothetical protein
MIDFENGFGKWIGSVPDAAAVCGEAAGCEDLNIKCIAFCFMLESLFCLRVLP